VDQERHLNLVPPDLREIAVLAEPLTIAEKALSQISWMMQQRPPWLDPQTPSAERGRGLSALVLGIGPVGLLGAMVLASAGFTTYVYSRELPPSHQARDNTRRRGRDPLRRPARVQPGQRDHYAACGVLLRRGDPHGAGLRRQ
jgi:hypothetical protein